MCDGEEIERLIARLWDRRWELEWRLAGGVLADLANSLPAALGAGACLELFEREDMRMLWFACTTWPQRGRDGLLPLLRDAFTSAGHWDPADTRPSVRGPRWNDRALVELAYEWHGPALIRLIARELRSVVRRIERSSRCWRLLEKLISPERDLWLPTVDRRPAAHCCDALPPSLPVRFMPSRYPAAKAGRQYVVPVRQAPSLMRSRKRG